MKLVTLLALLLFALPQQKSPAPMKGVRVLALRFEQSRRMSRDPDIRRLVTDMVGGAGARVVDADQAASDAKLTLVVNLEPLSARYGRRPLVDKILYTGAEAEVGLAFERGEWKLEKTFEGRIDPPKEAWTSSGERGTESRAPFHRAFFETGFLLGFAALAAELWDVGEAKIVASAVRDEEWDGQETLVRRLVELGGPDAVKRLVELLRAPDRGVRPAAAEALGDIGDRAAFEPLLQALTEKEGAVRSSAARALERLGHPDLVRRLIRIVRGPPDSTRVEAIDLVGRLGSAKAVPALIAVLSVSSLHDPVFRGAAGRRVLAAAVRALGRIGGLFRIEEARRAALGCVEDEALDVRTWAFFALHRLRHRPEEVLRSLLDLLDEERTTDSGRWDAPVCRALGEIGDRAAVPRLIEVLSKLGRDDFHYGLEVRKALYAITGVNPGRDAAAWRSWWEKSRSGESRER